MYGDTGDLLHFREAARELRSLVRSSTLVLARSFRWRTLTGRGLRIKVKS